MATMNVSETLLTEVDVSRQLRISLGTVRRWRLLRCGPRFLKIGALVRYRPEDVSRWLASRCTGGEHFDAAESQS